MKTAITRGRVMPLSHFETSVWSLVQKRSGWDGNYPQSAKNQGLYAWHLTCIRAAHESARSMVSIAGEIIADLQKHGATFSTASAA